MKPHSLAFALLAGPAYGQPSSPLAAKIDRSIFARASKMKHSLALSAALAMLLCSTAGAQKAVTKPDSPVLPPPQYDKPFEGKLTVERTTIAAVTAFCGGGTRLTFGCARVQTIDHEHVCHIKMASDIIITQHGFGPKDVLRHEIGHCNGWPGDHSNPPAALDLSQPPAPNNRDKLPNSGNVPIIHPIWRCPDMRDCSNMPSMPRK